jgi:fatty acid desaturase
VFLAVIFTQPGFLGHDAGHRQVFGTRRAGYVAGVLLGNLGIGLSYGWWVDRHNRHHAHPNTEDANPGIAVGALAFSQAQARAGGRLARLCSAARRTCSSRCWRWKGSTCTSRASRR